MKTLFKIHGPLEVPTYEGRVSRIITENEGRDFWRSFAHLGAERGCYVFGIRAGKGFTPGYVGKATKSFKQEVFTPHKLSKYQQMLADYHKGTPVLFFLEAPKRRGTPGIQHLSDLEDFLIQTGVAANEDLLNIKGTKQQEWGILGVLRSGQGKPSSDAQRFKQMMKI